MTSLSDCKNPSSAAASVIVSNVDMLTLILLRLPVQSLLVFKSICKQWFSIISDPFFSNKYNLQNSLSIQGLYTQTVPYWSSDAAPELDYFPLDGSSSSSAPFKTLSFIDDPLGFKIVQSCNGLMLCRSICTDYYRTYYICNPSTRKYRPIVCESQKHEKGFETLSSVNLAYDPLKSPHYKVVCIWLVSTDSNSNYQVEIYSSETASWKLSGEIFSKPGTPAADYYFDNGVFWNDSLHWLDKFLQEDLFYFNVDQELSKVCYYKSYDMDVKYFGECKGHLYIILGHVYSPTSFEILDMKTDYRNERFIVCLQELIRAYPRFKFDVLVVKEVKGASLNLVLRVQNKVISFDIQETSFKEIQHFAPGDLDTVAHRNIKTLAYQYIQTLACV